MFQRAGTAAALRAERHLGPATQQQGHRATSRRHCSLILGWFSHELNLDTSFLQKAADMSLPVTWDESWATSHKTAGTYLSLLRLFAHPGQKLPQVSLVG